MEASSLLQDENQFFFTLEKAMIQNTGGETQGYTQDEEHD